MTASSTRRIEVLGNNDLALCSVDLAKNIRRVELVEIRSRERHPSDLFQYA